LQTLHALSLKTDRTRGDNGFFVSPPVAVDNLSLQELADAHVPDPAPKKMSRKNALCLGRSFATMAANSKGGSVSVKDAFAMCALENAVPVRTIKWFGIRKKALRRLKGKSITELETKAKKGGRPKGTFKFPTSELKQILVDNSSVSCRFNSAGEAVRTLGQTWSTKHRKVPELFKAVPYSTLRRRCRHGKLAIEVGKKRTDLCGVCKAWDMQVEPIMKSLLNEIRSTLTKIMPQYFLEFDHAINESPLFENKQTLLQQPIYIERLIEYLVDHEKRNIASRLQLAPHDLVELRRAEDASLQELQSECLPVVQEWGGHFGLKDICSDALTDDFERPALRTTYILMDFQDPPPTLVEQVGLSNNFV
jgi:hypothetical protein